VLFGIAVAPVGADVQPREVQQPTAILTVISGGVLIQTTGGGYSRAIDGAVLYVGTMLRTSVDARAVITLSDGSIVELDPASDITIEDPTARGVPTIAQSLGRTWHVVVDLTGADTRYEPTTSGATASVRGGEYEVVTADGLSSLMTAASAPDDSVATTGAVTTNVKTVTSAQTTTVRVRKLKPVTRAQPVARPHDREGQSDREAD